MKIEEAKSVLEAALLCADEPLPMSALKRLFDGQFANEVLESLLNDVSADWAERPVQLVRVASGWRFQSRPEYAPYLARMTPERAPRYSRATLETLAIIAYRQPVTRGDIEEIRGVSVSSQIIRNLEDRGWIEVVGHKEVLGRPALFATTDQFLNDLSLRTLKELPSIDVESEAESAGAMGQNIIELVPASSPGPDEPAQTVPTAPTVAAQSDTEPVPAPGMAGSGEQDRVSSDAQSVDTEISVIDQPPMEKS